MIIKAKHNLFIYNFFKNYSLQKTKKVFENVIISGDFEEKNKPLLVIANHISWWDGFWIMYLNLRKLHKKFHFMMLEEQLKRYWYFAYSGGFSINKKSRTIIETLNYTTQLLKYNKNMVLIFPQGEIKSIYENKIIFDKGINRIIEESKNIQILMVVNLIDYFSKSKPSLYIYIKEYNSNETIENTYNSFYSQSVNEQKLKAF